MGMIRFESWTRVGFFFRVGADFGIAWVSGVW